MRFDYRMGKKQKQSHIFNARYLDDGDKYISFLNLIYKSYNFLIDNTKVDITHDIFKKSFDILSNKYKRLSILND